MICRLGVEATVVANEFIDRYMAGASGEYVKVYLYLLRHQREKVDVDRIAGALDLTESDVKRALAYWEKQGILEREDASGGENPVYRETAASDEKDGPAKARPGQVSGAEAWMTESETEAEPAPAPVQEKARPVYSQEQVNRLAGDEDFTQLLYIAQKYMNKVFTPRECEVFAYLYDGLHMSAELLEYVVEHCVQGGHTGIRYIETVAISWHEKGFATVEEARAYADGFGKDTFAVMRCFGLTDRKPGDGEKQMMERWFSEYGFSRELVIEACNRTMEAIHSPSFRYADKILSQWKKAGVKSVRDVALLDSRHQEKKPSRTVKRPANQFHNYEQRNTDYDSVMFDQVKSWIGEA